MGPHLPIRKVVAAAGVEPAHPKAMASKTIMSTNSIIRPKWGFRLGSNQRRSPYESGVLPLNYGTVKVVVRRGVEPLTYALRVRCSAS